MQKYRRTVEVDRDTDYYAVGLGPKPDVPAWHVLAVPSRHQFPSLEAAMGFAKAHKEIDLDREVLIIYPDGRVWDGKAWAA